MPVLLVSGLIGAVVGAWLYPTWHVAVETAQVVAGIVTYPPDNPFYTYHTKLWTILHQAGAGLLLLGLSERVISILISGLLGMLSFQAISMSVYALSRNTLIAIAAPFVVLAGRVADHGPLYPITLVGTAHTYGAVGLSAGVLAMALIGAGFYRSGGFLFGLLPAIHPSIGAWMLLIAGLAAATDLRRPDSPLREAVKYGLGGALITALSLAVQLTLITDVPDVDAETAARYFRGFVVFWDGHRYPLDLTMAGVSLNRAALILAIVWLAARRDLTDSARIWVRMIVASGAVSLGCLVLSWIPLSYLPVTLLQLMPSRVMNVNILVLPVLVIGILFALESTVAVQLARLAVLATFVLNANGIFWDWRPGLDRDWWIQRLGSWVITEFAVLAALALVAVSFWSRTKPVRAAPKPSWHESIAQASAVGVAVIALTAVYGTWKNRFKDPLDDRTNHPFWAEIAHDPDNGLTAIPGTSQFVQLYTRRPVIVNTGALDTLSYAPESGPALDRLLRDIYDLDLFNPPETLVAGSGSLSFEFNKIAWERFTRERWQAIRREYNVTQVMTYAPYVLDLPLVAETGSHKLYRIPLD